MRTSLFALTLFAFAFVGCAESLTGPDATLSSTTAETATSSARAPQSTYEASSPLFTTWSGTDGRSTYTVSFESRPSNADGILTEADLEFRFEGSGLYTLSGDISGGVEVKIANGVVSNGDIQFEIVEPGAKSVAVVQGQISRDFDVIETKILYPDGAVVAVPFKQVDVPLPVGDVEA